MRRLALSILVILAFAGPAAAFSDSSSDYYTNVSGHRVHRPEPHPTSRTRAPRGIFASARARRKARNCKLSISRLNHAGAPKCRTGASPAGSVEQNSSATVVQYSFGE